MSKRCVEADVLLMRRRSGWYWQPYIDRILVYLVSESTRSNLLAHVLVAHDVAKDCSFLESTSSSHPSARATFLAIRT